MYPFLYKIDFLKIYNISNSKSRISRWLRKEPSLSSLKIKRQNKLNLNKLKIELDPAFPRRKKVLLFQLMTFQQNIN